MLLTLLHDRCVFCFLRHPGGTDTAGRDNHQRVLRISKALEGSGLTTWIDENEMRGDIVERMVEGIDNSAVVLV